MIKNAKLDLHCDPTSQQHSKPQHFRLPFCDEAHALVLLSLHLSPSWLSKEGSCAWRTPDSIPGMCLADFALRTTATQSGRGIIFFRLPFVHETRLSELQSICLPPSCMSKEGACTWRTPASVLCMRLAEFAWRRLPRCECSAPTFSLAIFFDETHALVLLSLHPSP